MLAPTSGGVVLAAPEDDNLDDTPGDNIGEPSENDDEQQQPQQPVEDPRKMRKYNIQVNLG